MNKFLNRELLAEHSDEGKDLSGNIDNVSSKVVAIIDTIIKGKIDLTETEKNSLREEIQKLYDNLDLTKILDIFKINEKIVFIGSNLGLQSIFVLGEEKKEDFFRNIKNTHEIDGKVYYDGLAIESLGGHSSTKYGAVFKNIEYGTNFRYSYEDLPEASEKKEIEASDYIIGKQI